MNSTGESDRQGQTYAMGRSPEETDRLIRQGRFRGAFTRQLFEEAGMTADMRILDVGCGAGDVALLAAEFVGPSGAVVGIDHDPRILATAEARVRAAGLANVTFRTGDVHEVALEGPFDGAVGRYILMHTRDPGALLGRLAEVVRPGGLIAFQEFDLGVDLVAWPPSPLLERSFGWCREVFNRAGVDAQMGRKLHRVFLEAGLSAPQMRLEAPMGGGVDYAGYQDVADAVRSLLPLLVRFGIATPEEVGIETLAERLRAEIVGQRGVAMSPVHVGAWTHKT